MAGPGHMGRAAGRRPPGSTGPGAAAGSCVPADPRPRVPWSRTKSTSPRSGSPSPRRQLAQAGRDQAAGVRPPRRARPARRPDHPAQAAAGAGDPPGAAGAFQDVQRPRPGDARRRVDDQRHRPVRVDPQPGGPAIQHQPVAPDQPAVRVAGAAACRAPGRAGPSASRWCRVPDSSTVSSRSTSGWSRRNDSRISGSRVSTKSSEAPNRSRPRSRVPGEEAGGPLVRRPGSTGRSRASPRRPRSAARRGCPGRTAAARPRPPGGRTCWLTVDCRSPSRRRGLGEAQRLGDREKGPQLVRVEHASTVRLLIAERDDSESGVRDSRSGGTGGPSRGHVPGRYDAGHTYTHRKWST